MGANAVFQFLHVSLAFEVHTSVATMQLGFTKNQKQEIKKTVNSHLHKYLNITCKISEHYLILNLQPSITINGKPCNKTVLVVHMYIYFICLVIFVYIFQTCHLQTCLKDQYSKRQEHTELVHCSECCSSSYCNGKLCNCKQ